VSEDRAFYDRALRRMTWLAIALGAAASIYIGLRFKWIDALGCAAGAAAAIFNFHWWKRLTGGLEPSSETRSQPRSAVFLGLRYLILGAVCFAIIKIFEVNYLALIIGLMVPVAAVLAEIVFELVVIRS
jgi:hypothetical protein